MILKEDFNEEQLGFLKAEIKILSFMDHPYIVNYKECFEDERYLFIVMECIEEAQELHVCIMKREEELSSDETKEEQPFF